MAAQTEQHPTHILLPVAVELLLLALMAQVHNQAPEVAALHQAFLARL
jgi:hypothetical protein